MKVVCSVAFQKQGRVREATEVMLLSALSAAMVSQQQSKPEKPQQDVEELGQVAVVRMSE